MNRHMLSKDIVVADFQAGRLIAILEVLRPLPQNGAAEDDVAFPHPQRSAEVHVGPQDAPSPDTHFPFDNHVRTDLDIVGQSGLRRNDGRRVNAGGLRVRHAGSRSEWRGSRKRTRAGWAALILTPIYPLWLSIYKPCRGFKTSPVSDSVISP